MSLTVESRTAMQECKSMVMTADNVKGPEQGNWTYEDYAALPDDGKHYEVVDGVLLIMTPAPDKWHQKAVGRIFRYLAAYIEDTGRGEVYIAPFDVQLATNMVVQPDITVLLKPNLARATNKCIVGAPDLVVEVASPATATHDRHNKLAVYEQAKVPEYWIVEPATHTVEVLCCENGKYHSLGVFEGKNALPSRVLPGFSPHIGQFFA